MGGLSSLLILQEKCEIAVELKQDTQGKLGLD